MGLVEPGAAGGGVDFKAVGNAIRYHVIRVQDQLGRCLVTQRLLVK